MDRFTFIRLQPLRLQTKSGQTYDYETHELFVVRVTADDSNGGTKTATVVISVRNLAEPPQAPTGLTLVQVYPTSMALSWTPPDNTGRPAITGYDLQYKKSTESAWTAGPQGLTDTSDSITGLDPSTSYHVQVRANNDDGNGAVVIDTLPLDAQHIAWYLNHEDEPHRSPRETKPDESTS